MSAEIKYDIDSLTSRFPNLSRNTIEAIINSYDRETGIFSLPGYNRHSGKIEDFDAIHEKVFDHFSQQPKKSPQEKIEEMIVHNRELLGLLTDIFGWDPDDPFRPDVESIRQGY